MSYNTYEKPVEVRVKKEESKNTVDIVSENIILDNFLEELKSVDKEALERSIRLSFRDQTGSFTLSKNFK